MGRAIMTDQAATTRRLVIPAPPVALIPVKESDAFFPVRRIWCIGRNYADHALEMGADPGRDPPSLCAQPTDASVPTGGRVAYPVGTRKLHHEVELAVAIGKGGRNIDPIEAESHIFGYAIALDMTRRDLQDTAKTMRRPWDMAKGFDQSCPISEIQPRAAADGVNAAQISLSINGQVRQQGAINQMIWSVAECIAALSRLVELQAGDILLTGTPAGVGEVHPGDKLHAQCEGIGDLDVEYFVDAGR
jgi:fumarylpyruvate hydrolase